MLSLRHRNIFLVGTCLLFIFFGVPFLRGAHMFTTRLFSPTYTLRHKPPTPLKSYPIVDNFPLAAAAHSAADLPPIPEWNQPPSPHGTENTPLFIGFTQNWQILQQVVVSYITAGWPPSDIYVIENTGVMDSNKRGLLSLQNPFFLNHTRLNMLGVNILVTPTLLSFAQLQNYYLHTSIEHEWETYFWSHMNVIAVSYEKDHTSQNEQVTENVLPPSYPKQHYTSFSSLYNHCVSELRKTTLPDPQSGKLPRWAMRFFSYDRLALVNVAALVEVGGWDTLIPYYHTDCDMYARLEMAGFEIKNANPGYVFDVASSLDDLVVLYRKKGTVEASFQDPGKIEEELKAKAGKTREVGEADKREAKVQLDGNSEAAKEFIDNAMGKELKWEDDEIASERFLRLERTLDEMSHPKGADGGARNTWQFRQTGGQGDPFYRDSLGFKTGIRMAIDHGRSVFAEKWGHRDCDIVAVGLKPEDAWRVKHDWESF